MNRAAWILLAAYSLTAIGGCDHATAMKDPLTPLAELRLQPAGQLADVLASDRELDKLDLRAALVWGAVPSAKRFCLLYGSELPLGPPASVSVTAVAEAGCDDPLGFRPALSSSGASLADDGPTTIVINYLPIASVLVGQPQGRVGYASVVIYDDRNHNGALDIHWSWRNFAYGDDFGEAPDDSKGPGNKSAGKQEEAKEPDRKEPELDPDDPLGFKTPDEVYGASFVSMFKPNTRVAFREGDFGPQLELFYPTVGCEAPAAGFSIIAASGLPTKSTCVASALGDEILDIPLQATQTLAHVACRPSEDRYYDTERKADLELPWACLSDNHLVVANPPGPCKGVTEFLLKGCHQSAECEEPDWDETEKPPKWWPCHDTKVEVP